MTALKADRRLYETPEKDAIVEEGDVRGRWLLAGLGSTIGASDVEKYHLEMKRGRVHYPGCPELETPPGVKKAPKPEDKAATEHEDKGLLFKRAEREEKTLRFGGDGEDEEGGEDGEDDSDRNKEDASEPSPEWTDRMSAEKYIERYPTGPKAKLAAAVIAAQDDGADGES